jgi:hypothetical protein
MATVVKKYVGLGWLALGGETWWKWKITFGDVWIFWADPIYLAGTERVFQIVQVHSQVWTDGSRWAWVNIKNVGPNDGYFTVRVADITGTDL